MDIRITSDCEKARQLGERCTRVSLGDVMDFYGCRVNSEEIRGNLWLLPIGVSDAAGWNRECSPRAYARRSGKTR
ncbi:MAG: hypothetical protein AB7S83_00255 [Candidatus Methanomethylophilaceae archaeon]